MKKAFKSLYLLFSPLWPVRISLKGPFLPFVLQVQIESTNRRKKKKTQHGNMSFIRALELCLLKLDVYIFVSLSLHPD